MVCRSSLPRLSWSILEYLDPYHNHVMIVVPEAYIFFTLHLSWFHRLFHALNCQQILLWFLSVTWILFLTVFAFWQPPCVFNLTYFEILLASFFYSWRKVLCLLWIQFFISIKTSVFTKRSLIFLKD